MGGGPFFLSYYYKKWCGNAMKPIILLYFARKNRYGPFAIK